VIRPVLLGLLVLGGAGCGGGTERTETQTVPPRSSAPPGTVTTRRPPPALVRPNGASYAYRRPAGLSLLHRPSPREDAYGFKYRTVLGFSAEDQVQIAEDPAGFSYDRLPDRFFRGRLTDTLRASLTERNRSVTPGSFATRRGVRSILFDVVARPGLHLAGARFVYFYFGSEQVLLTCQWSAAGEHRVRRACRQLAATLELRREPSARSPV
jgi:hypothetical protein